MKVQVKVFRGRDFNERCPEDYGKIADWCPLIPVPYHGRLIDADALDDILADQSEDPYNRTHAPRSWERALSVMRDYLDDAPTIIPADIPDMNVGDNGESREGQAPPLHPRNDGEEVVTDG